MPSLDDLKKRIKSVKNTQKITKAMKMVAAAKLKKAQEKAENGRPYSDRMQDIILNLTKSISDKSNAPKLLFGNGKDEVYLGVVITADRGLCGGFNTNICKLAKKSFKDLLNNGKKIKILTAGSKGHDQLKREFENYIIENISFKDKKNITFKEANQIGNLILKLFNEEKFDKCLIFYNNFKNVITQIPQEKQIIPAGISNEKNSSEEISSYDFEPDEDEILEDLLPKNISTQIF